MSSKPHRIFYRRHLPHIQPPGATLFVTFRLANSISPTLQAQLAAQTERMDRRLDQIEDVAERESQAYVMQKRLFARWDRALDGAQTGPHWLRRPEIAGIAQESLHYLDGDRYDLDTFCIMSNHVHAIFTPRQRANESYYPLQTIMQSLKGFTARQANEILGRGGQFWQHENYDHAIRNEAELKRIRRYVLQNPVQAGVVNVWDEWPWSFTAVHL